MPGDNKTKTEALGDRSSPQAREAAAKTAAEAKAAEIEEENRG